MKRSSSLSSIGRFILVSLYVLSLSSSTTQAAHFSQLSSRTSTGDPQRRNPISNTEGPKCITSGDLNADGLADMVVGNLDGSVSVLLADGDEAVQEQILCDAGGSIRDVVCADFNRDGHLDVAAANITGGVSLLLGQGDGQLIYGGQVPMENARTLAAGDCDSDGNVDLLVGCSPPDCELCDDFEEDCDSRSVSILYGDGQGSFPRQHDLVNNGFGCIYDVALADLDRDGILDAVALDLFGLAEDKEHGRVMLFQGLGQGWFGDPVMLITRGRGPRDLCIDYVDEQVSGTVIPPGAFLDIVVANRDSASLDVFLGLPDFAFSEPRVVGAGDSPRSIAAGDLNGDGQVELVVANRNMDTISVLRGLGEARFATPLEFPAGRSPRQIVLADITGDGVLDAGVVNRVSQDMSVYVGRSGLVGFLLPGAYYPGGINPKDIVAEDFDGDGYPDVAYVNLRSHDLRIRLNQGDGSYGPEIIYPAGHQPSCLAAGDLDGDGLCDLVVAAIGASNSQEESPGAILCYMGMTDGTFEPPITITTPNLYLKPHWLRLGDLDNDEKMDLAVTDVLGKLVLFKGNGRGRFLDPVWLKVGSDTRAITVTLGDVDNDSQMDIMTSHGKVLLNNGRFWVPGWSGPVLAFGSKEREIARSWVIESADLDQDGNLDLILTVTFVNPDPIAVFYGQGDGTFLEPDIYGGPDQGVVDIFAEDLDSDGILDIAVGNRCGASVIIMQGQGDRSFKRIENVRTYSVEGIAIKDLNLDGRPDIIGTGQGVWVVLNGMPPALADPRDANPMGLSGKNGLCINEIMPQNEFYHQSDDGRSPDWVELHNHSDNVRSLSGWSLYKVTPKNNLLTWAFPIGTEIAPWDHVVIFCEKRRQDVETGLWCHAFELDKDGESLILVDHSGRYVDQVDYPSVPADVSYARTMDGARFLGYNPVPTLGMPNVRPANIGPSIELREPFLSADGPRLGIRARLFDDVGIAYASIHYQLDLEGPVEEIILNNDGLHGDGNPGDQDYGALLPLLPPEQQVTYWIRAVDLEGAVKTRPSDPAIAADLLTLSQPPAHRPLRISEVLPDNMSGYLDEEGRAEDWLELVNCGSEDVRLSDYLLTKDFYDPNVTRLLPEGIVLKPGETIVFFCDDDTHEGPLHLHFKLDADGDRVFLMKRGSEDALVWMDELSFGAMPPDVSWGRPGCDEDAVELAEPTPGAVNAAHP